ncbi:MAG: nicotinate-nucleotide--dimethylbenzimidazole phosphoribosyltransferase [Bacteroides sp.]|nr:nicotinate-nucleotide--dimethylbenzimidazole phosphoribosyltransferase [Bacteroides sp.]
MRIFNITPTNKDILQSLQAKVDNLAKPKGSLGTLERLAIKVGLIQQTLSPSLTNPHNIIFASDHGIADEGVSFSPKEVTWQQTCNFVTSQGAGINFLCRQNGFQLMVVDAGVDCDLPNDIGIVDKKVRKGTRNFLYEDAMTYDEYQQCIERGAECVDIVHKKDCNVISFGEMGIGNTSASSVWASLIGNIPLEKSVGAGSGLDSDGVTKKYNVLKKSVERNNGAVLTTEQIMCAYGGYEMVMAVGAMLRAAELKMTIIIDGFIMTSCILAASRLYPSVLDYALFGHCGSEKAHRELLETLSADYILDLGLRLGEGSGAVCAYPIILSAVNMINNMDSFADSAVTKYF